MLLVKFKGKSTKMWTELSANGKQWAPLFIFTAVEVLLLKSCYLEVALHFQHPRARIMSRTLTIYLSYQVILTQKLGASWRQLPIQLSSNQYLRKTTLSCCLQMSYF